MAIILASSSPRRRELLEQIGCQFTVITSDIVEDNTQDLPPAELAVTHARNKALEVARKCSPDDVVIGADTIVLLDGQVYGKPVDAGDARRMLSRLTGNEHHVISGVAIVKGEDVWTDFVVTAVRMKKLSSQEIERYVATGEPMDKAGGYAIQGIGTMFVESICGCYTNVVGLPLSTLETILKKAGVYLL